MSSSGSDTARSGSAPSCRVIHLPAPHGGALVSPLGWNLEPASDHHLFDLAQFGAVAATLAPGDLPGSTARMLEALRWVVGADDAEAFFVEPLRNDLLMAACVGPDRDVLCEREVFAPGAGYPGIVAAKGQAVVTRSAIEDRRFLRNAAKRRGLRSYVCVPIPGPRGPMGSVDLAWHAANAPLERALCVLEHVAPLLGATISASLAESRERVRRAVESSGRNLPELSRALVHELTRAAGARSGTLVLEDGIRHVTLQVVSTDAEAGCCRGDGMRTCPYLAQGRSKVLVGPRPRWPETCRRLPARLASPCCVPLLRADGIRGTLLLDYGESKPAPLTRDLVVLLHMAQESAEWLGAAVEAGSPASTSARPDFAARCFGGFELELAGKRVAREAFSRKKAITLLQMLLLKAGGSLQRSSIIERLWPGVDEEAGSNRLHGVVHALRSVIEPRSRRGWRFVKNDGELYWLDADSLQGVDLVQFKKALSDAASAERDGRIPEAIARLEEAVALYRGDLFADEPAAELWLAERASLRERCFAAHKKLGALLREMGELDRAIHWLKRAVDLDPLREDLQQHLIEGLARAGRRKDAIEQYRSCVSIVQQELGSTPMPATTRLGRMLDLFESA